MIALANVRPKASIFHTVLRDFTSSRKKPINEFSSRKKITDELITSCHYTERDVVI